MTSTRHQPVKKEWNFENLQVFATAFWLIGLELWRGVIHRTLPLWCFWVGIAVCAALGMRLDTYPWRRANAAFLYPSHPWVYWPYAAFLIGIGFWCWGLYRVGARRQLVNRLTEAFKTAGLETSTHRVPGFIDDEPLDEFCRKLVLQPVGLPLSQFQKAKERLQACLGVYIDEFREDIARGTLTMLYAHEPMSPNEPLENVRAFPGYSFAVGKGRSGWVVAKLQDIPHYLVAGLTNSGKSTFLRQAITTLYLNNPKMEFSLIDLKGGLEFQLFEGLKRVRVFASASQALTALRDASAELDHRIGLLRDRKCKDIIAYNQLEDVDRIARKLLVVDEAAELFLAGDGASANESQEARRVASHIAAQGRAVGIHLIIATQRPDKTAVASHTKTNLQGRLCFQMADNASSMTILDSGRATDLPPVAGRAIWKNGFSLTEIQAPYLSVEKTEEALAPYRPAPVEVVAVTHEKAKAPKTIKPPVDTESEDDLLKGQTR